MRIHLYCKTLVFAVVTLFCVQQAAWSQSNHPLLQPDTVRFNGVVKAEGAEEPLIGATILVKGSDLGAVTDVNGFFQLAIPAGKYHIEISYVGFITANYEVEIYSDAGHVFHLEQKSNLLQTIEVSDQGPDHNVTSTDISVSKLSIQSIKALPSLLGEADVVRGLQTLPGVTTVGEGASGFNVRGGSIDQNWVLMEDIPIFNTSHLLGLFSVFHPDAVKDLIFYRGGIPANYGGRGSSVLDVRLKDPERGAWKYKGGIGLVSNRFTAEGPIAGDKLTFLAAGRASFPDYLFKVLSEPRLRSTNANYYDLTTRLKWQISEHDQVALTAYFSQDAFKMAGDSLTGLEVNASSTLFQWFSEGASLRWNHFFSPKFSSSLTGVASRYRPTFSIPDDAYAATFRSGIFYKNIKAETNYYGQRHERTIGLSLTTYDIKPGSLQPDSELSSVNPVQLAEERSLEAAIYANDQWNISDKLSLMLGLRYVRFANLGPGQVYGYEEGAPRDELTRNDTTQYANGDVIADFGGLEPRLALRFSINDKNSIKMGAQRMRQYVQLVSNTTAALPTDRWKLSDDYLLPQTTDQISLGYFTNLKNNTIEASLELFYKRQENLPDYRSGANLLLLEAPETAILQGEGRAYGAELQLRKMQGRLIGWISYTFSNSEVLINSPYPEDEAFSGAYYPTNYNRPHVLNIAATYVQSEKITYSANFTYSSGRPATYPTDKYYIGGVYVPNFVDRNRNLIPDYHRLDLSMTVVPNPDSTKRWKGRWQFSLYNVYARKNPFSIFFKTRNTSPIRANNRVEAYRLSVLGTIIPSISYEFTF